MSKRIFATLMLVGYGVIVVKVLVFKDIPTIRLGHLRLSFGGTQDGAPNLIPFKTILSYLEFRRGLLVSSVNIIGNIIALVPAGFLVPMVLQQISSRKIMAFAVGCGVAIEMLQAVLRVGIFDIDDVILNGLGVMVGYWIFRCLSELLNGSAGTS